ncbi:SMC-Scp complex subunit ScpB [Candidatus Falkowbacteria bacterium]|jgi:segregation and condensation protein B|nr:SMC-Scp complex subunit ScpB [Candidatus Falkowbacteria bacterium]MBT5503747.1 SMC-Scp complex subunit ScpB [Candidatus Falkowbacteria bacterium]MBT6573774.1 SMC-Scp complex subunit ScpB [Candidatus Falkowbacteria bacterium]MBT7348136.1 SMC-Scp complex subunit ScpB [Candidatus Falkowbacteria bacterium]MBT7500722.1 SMC-Scp complex subunit ScpB [Candidatus Falkowbacteria bacterium]
MKTKIESLLFISSKPLTAKSIVSFLTKQGEQITAQQVLEIVEDLKQKYNRPESGVQLVQAGNELQMTTNPDVAEIIKKFLKDDITGELTPASLETLTVVAYRGPITKPELEQIRGVNCSLIIRNLLIRGLITFETNKNSGQNSYEVTIDFLKHLGLNNVKELPDYERLSKVENLEQYLENK